MLYYLKDEDGVYVADDKTNAPYTKHEKWAKEFTRDEAIERSISENISNAYNFQMIPIVQDPLIPTGMALRSTGYRLHYINSGGEWELCDIGTLEDMREVMLAQLPRRKCRIEETLVRTIEEQEAS